MTVSPPSVSSALVTAHPAHELRVLGWLGRARPLVSVLTTGSRNGVALDRLERTAEIVAAAGGRRGSLFGAARDRDLYAAILEGDAAGFQDWIAQLCEDFVRQGVDLVVADAWQGYSPAHDLAHLIARLAAARAGGILGRQVRVVEYEVVPQAIAPLHPEAWPAFSLTLDPTEAAAKRAAVASYPDIVQETAEIAGIEGAAGLLEERFFVPAPFDGLLGRPAGRAYYERAGEDRVARGLYQTVLRERHVTSLARALIAEAPAVAAVASPSGETLAQASL